MDKNTERLFEINQRKAELRSIVEKNEEGINLEEIETELRGLDNEVADIEKRMKLIDSIDVKTIEKPEEEKRNMDKDYGVDSAEYRSAFFKHLLGKELNEEEKRAYSVVPSTGAPVPTQTADQLIEKMKQIAPVLNEITLLNVDGNVNFSVEGVRDDAAIHTENAAITPAGDTLVTVSLTGFDIVKLVRISKTVQTMSINAFEGWIVNMIAEDIARKIENYLINGTGSGQPQGVDTANTWSTTNSVTVAAGANPTVADVTALLSLLPAGYDARAKIVMNKKTLFGDFVPLENDAANPLVRQAADGSFTIYGYPVLLSDYVAQHVAYLGDFTKIVGNLAQNVTIETSVESGFTSRSVDFLGSVIFDSKVALGEAFVKLAKASS